VWCPFCCGGGEASGVAVAQRQGLKNKILRNPLAGLSFYGMLSSQWTVASVGLEPESPGKSREFIVQPTSCVVPRIYEKKI